MMDFAGVGSQWGSTRAFHISTFKLNSNSCTVLITLVFVYQVQNENKFRTDHSCNEIALTFDMDLWELLHCYSNKFKKLQMVVWFDMSYGKL
mgnify:CR=1 FL=1